MASSDLVAIGTFAANGLLRPRDLYSSVGPTLNELSFGLLGSYFEPERDVIDLTGKVVFVTGGRISIVDLGSSIHLRFNYYR